MIKARIYKPTKTAMQSGKAKTSYWCLEYIAENGRFKDPFMGWTGSTNMWRQVLLKFPDLDSAVKYAQKNSLDYRVDLPQTRKILPKRYSDNFRYDKVI
jgi:hypothetical protein